MNHDPRTEFSRLLDHRTRAELLRMNDGDRARLLAEILGKGPSEASWQALWELFAGWPANASKNEHLVAAERALATWEDRLRVASSADMRMYEAGRLAPLASLARSIEVYRREEHGSAEVKAIGSSVHAEGLAYLSIVRSEIDSDAWRALVESPHLFNLRHLHISGTMLLPASFERLFRSSQLRRLRCLELIDVGLRVRDLENAGASMPLSELDALDLSSNGLGDGALAVLSSAPALRQLRRMSLRNNFIEARAIRALLSSAFADHLEQLDATGNRVTDAERLQLVTLAMSRQVQLIV